MFTISDKFVVDNNGNIGIGTDKPMCSLHIYGQNNGIILPKSSSVSVPIPGMIYIDTTTNNLLLYTDKWNQLSNNLVISNISTTNFPNTNSTATVTGTSFEPTLQWSWIGKDGTRYYPDVEYNNSTNVTIYRPSDVTVANAPYKLMVHSIITGLDYISPSIELQLGVNPSYITNGGSLGTYFIDTSVNVIIETTDEIGGGISSMEVSNGTLPTGLSSNFRTYNSIGGILDISGAVNFVAALTTYTFSVTSTDLGANSVVQSFSITIKPSFPSNPWTVLDANKLNQTNNTGVTSWGFVRTFGQATEVNQPTYFSTGGYSDGSYVQFNSVNSNYMNAGVQQLNTDTNGGFTLMTLIKFTGSATAWERIIEFVGASSDYMYVSRNSNGSGIRVSFNTTVLDTSTGLDQNVWNVIAVRYTKSSTSLQIYKNNVVIGSSSVATTNFTNRSIVNSYIGYTPNTSIFSNFDLAKLFIYDGALSDSDMTLLYIYMFDVPTITSSQPANISKNTFLESFTASYTFTANELVVWSLNDTTYGNISSSAGTLTLTFPIGTQSSGTFTVTATNDRGNTATVSWNYVIISTEFYQQIYYPNIGDVSPLFITKYNNTDYTGQTGWNQRIDGQYHSLFPMSGYASTGFYYNNLSSLGSKFTITFDWYYGKRACCFAADGISMHIYANSTIIDPSVGVGNSGWMSKSYGGYAIYIQRYDYLSQRYVQILYNDTEIYKSGTISEPGFDQFFPVSLVFNAGVITVTLNSITIGSYTHGVTATYTNPYVAFIGRSGYDHSEQRIRNLVITRN